MEGIWYNKVAVAQVSGPTRYTRPVIILPVLRGKNDEGCEAGRGERASRRKEIVPLLFVQTGDLNIKERITSGCGDQLRNFGELNQSPYT